MSVMTSQRPCRLWRHGGHGGRSLTMDCSHNHTICPPSGCVARSTANFVNPVSWKAKSKSRHGYSRSNKPSEHDRWLPVLPVSCYCDSSCRWCAYLLIGEAASCMNWWFVFPPNATVKGSAQLALVSLHSHKTLHQKAEPAFLKSN